MGENDLFEIRKKLIQIHKEELKMLNEWEKEAGELDDVDEYLEMIDKARNKLTNFIKNKEEISAIELQNLKNDLQKVDEKLKKLKEGT